MLESRLDRLGRLGIRAVGMVALGMLLEGSNRVVMTTGIWSWIVYCTRSAEVRHPLRSDGFQSRSNEVQHALRLDGFQSRPSEIHEVDQMRLRLSQNWRSFTKANSRSIRLASFPQSR